MSAAVLQFPSRPEPTMGGTDPEASRLLPVSKLKQQFNDYLSSKVEENREAQEADSYYHDAQWSAEDLEVLKLRGQPEVTYNREKRKVNTVVGILERARQDPKAYPNKPTPGAEDGAELATKVVRFLIGWDWQHRTVQIARRGAVRAIAGVELVITPSADGGNPEIELDDVDQRDFFYDPKSQKHDFSDARYLGTKRRVAMDVAMDQWPDSGEDLKAYTERAPGGSWDKADTRSNVTWFNRSDESVLIVDHWYKRGSQWYYAIYCGDVILEEGESPHRVEKGRSWHKFRMYSCEIDQDGDRYAFHRTLKGAQDEVNHRRSKALHALNTRRTIYEKGAFDDPDKARQEIARVDGMVERNQGYEAEVQTNDHDVSGNLEMLAEAKNEIENYGPNPGLIGTTVEAASGKAIKLLQAAGIAELGTYVIAFKHWKLSVYRMLWFAAQQFWTGEQWVRYTDQEGMAQFVQLNGWEKDEFGFPVIINNLSSLDVDIILDEGDDVVSATEDTFDIIVEMAGKGIQIPPDVIIELSRLPGSVKKRVMSMMSAGNQPNPVDLQAMQIKLEQEIAKVKEIQGNATLRFAQADQIQMEMMRGPEGSPQQVDTPADLAKARLDMAKADEIHHKIQGGGKEMPTMFDVAEQQARTAETGAKAQRMSLETANLARFGAVEPAKLDVQREAAQARAKAPTSNG